MDKGLSNLNEPASYIIKIQDYSRRKYFIEEPHYHQFLTLLYNYAVRFDFYLHAFVLLSDYAQLLISIQSYQEIERVFDEVLQGYVSYFNFTNRRVHLLDLELKIEKLNLHTSLVPYYRYIETLPVRSGVVKHPADYPWSSYGSNALGENVGLITEHESYLSLGPDENARWTTYRASFDII